MNRYHFFFFITRKMKHEQTSSTQKTSHTAYRIYIYLPAASLRTRAFALLSSVARFVVTLLESIVDFAGKENNLIIMKLITKYKKIKELITERSCSLTTTKMKKQFNQSYSLKERKQTNKTNLTSQP